MSANNHQNVMKPKYGVLKRVTFFFQKRADFGKIHAAPHSAMCLGFGHTFFSRNPTFSEVFKQKNVGVIGNVFMQYFISSLLYAEIGEKKLKS